MLLLGLHFVSLKTWIS